MPTSPPEPAPNPPLVELVDVHKSFGPQAVLRGVSFDVRPGEVHALAGENGAGKSTLIKILCGVHRDFTGWLVVGGRPVALKSPADALRHGIATIHQELSLVASMSVADNLFLGRERTTPLGLLARRRQERQAREVLVALGLDIHPRRTLASLPVAARQMVEIARALAGQARVLVMDEPTSALGEPEAERLFARIGELKARGAGIVYVTHRMQEIYRLADRITVLRDGIAVGTATPSDLPRPRLLRWMIGRDLGDVFPARRAAPGAPLLAVRNLVVADPQRPGRDAVRDVSFTLGKGEILGLFGLQGAGASDLLHALFGDRRRHGSAELDGRRLGAGSPRAALRRGLALLTSDRASRGIVATLPVVENATLASLERYTRCGLVDRRRETAAVEPVARSLSLRAPSLGAPITALSGGNQQKVLLARCLLAGPRVLLLDEPTRGIDVAAKADVYALLRRFTAEGGGVLLITSEIEELLGLAHRILVLSRGRLSAELWPQDTTAEQVLHAAMEEAPA